MEDIKENKDLASGRLLIEKDMPISDGIFRRDGQPGIVVDSAKLLADGDIATSVNSIKTTNLDLMNTAVVLGRNLFPINPSAFPAFQDQKLKDRVSLHGFAEQGKGIPDAQALFVAFLLEIRVMDENKKLKNIISNNQRRVSIVKDPGDGRAVVYFQRKRGEVYKFDSSKGDTKFNMIPDIV